jgi:tRNA threonylcarbamoyl adenosine modification protein YeaZ
LNERKTVLKTLFLVYSTKRRRLEIRFKVAPTSHKILAMVGSFGTTTVAIFADQKCLAKRSIPSNTCSKFLISEIKHLFMITAISLKDIAVIMTELGPGSFTGLRILVVTANALGRINQIPVLGINSLTCLALQLINTIPQDSLLVPLINAYGGQAYAGVFNVRNRQELHNNLCLSPEELVALLATLPQQLPIFVAGKTSDDYKNRLLAKLPKSTTLNFLSEDIALPTVEGLVALGLLDLEKHPISTLATEIEPVYIKVNFGGELSITKP